MRTKFFLSSIEPLPFPQRSPGPIQRPNKLSCPTVIQKSSFFTDSTRSPSTPDVLVQINHLLDHQNSIPAIPSTPNVSNAVNSSTPNVQWSPFASTEWSLKFESSWPVTNIPSPNVPLTTRMPNPFAQQQTTKVESSIWPSVLGTVTPCTTASGTDAECVSHWNELFSTTAPSSNESTETTNNSWLQLWPESDPSQIDSTPPNTEKNEANDPVSLFNEKKQ